MTRLGDFGRLSAFFLPVLLGLAFQGADCELLVSPVGPTLVNALAGSNVTLAVSFSGAPDPAVTWSMGNLPVVTWAINSPAAPDIPVDRQEVLKVEPNGSLTFVNVPLNYTNNYTIEMIKSGLGTSSATFTLRVYEKIQSVILSTMPDFAQEGGEPFTLQYSMQGLVEQERWSFNGIQINTNLHYSVEQQRLVIRTLSRNDTGQYAVLLTNPFSSVTVRINVTVLYGPDEPILEAHPAQPFYIPGDSLILSCQADGFPKPAAKWAFGGHNLSDSSKGVLNLTHVQTSQGGVYTCTLINEQTEKQRSKSMTLNIYGKKRPLVNPMCSVQSVNNVELQYHCLWLGGTPPAQLSFPALSNSSSGGGNLSLTVAASDNLNGKTVTCMADQPMQGICKCSIQTNVLMCINDCSSQPKTRTSSFPGRPVKFLPAVTATVDSEGQIVVTIHCLSEASPRAVVSWSKGSEAITVGTAYQISSDTTQLKIRDYNISNFIHQNYTCTCRNPLGSERWDIQLKGPSISDSSLFPNQDGTVVTLTWEVPPTSIVTGFDIQMKGPDLRSRNHNATLPRGNSNSFHTIQQKPGSARSADIFVLDPNLSYRFRVIPKARMTEGEPSAVHRIGPGTAYCEGLSGTAIAGIAAGIPCSLLFLLLLGGSIYLCVYCNKNKSRRARYPLSRAVEKAITTQTDMVPHNLLAGGLKSAPDYNRLQKVVFLDFYMRDFFCKFTTNKLLFSFRLPLIDQGLSPPLSLHPLSELLQLSKLLNLLVMYMFVYLFLHKALTTVIVSLMMYSFMGGGLFCAIVGNILLVVSTATDYWMQYRLSGSFAHQGLWRYCMSGKCYMQTDSIAYWNATRAFMILSAMSCFAGIIAGILSFAHFSAFERFNRSFAAGIMFFVSMSPDCHPDWRSMSELEAESDRELEQSTSDSPSFPPLASVWTESESVVGGSAALFVLLAMAIYTGVTVNFLGKRFGDWHFSWSYILDWVALLMTFFAGIFYMCAYRMHECRRVAGPR
ncbi:hypothetical protein L3Q82_013450 [Scortum barcoo]|uniref:Uncharacterized protein n=1 Tax=Scortum barcoo TaxID=214431 RepID=A0ACB8W0R6_9TELE|nr:hypothetical protein L3Q82_013450 [Scortum barcoo]